MRTSRRGGGGRLMSQRDQPDLRAPATSAGTSPMGTRPPRSRPRCVSAKSVGYLSPYPSARSKPMCAAQMSKGTGGRPVSGAYAASAAGPT